VGDIFRWNVQNHTKMGAMVRRIMAAGELVGDDLRKSLGLPPYQGYEGEHAASRGPASA
jgi:hypothetical protein